MGCAAGGSYATTHSDDASILSVISIWISKFLGCDSLSGFQEFSLADNEFYDEDNEPV